MATDTMKQSQRLQITRELDAQDQNKRAAHQVVKHYGSKHNWPEEDVAQVVDMLGLEQPSGLIGSWEGYNGRSNRLN